MSSEGPVSIPALPAGVVGAEGLAEEGPEGHAGGEDAVPPADTLLTQGVLDHGGVDQAGEESGRVGCANGFWRSVGRFPIKFPMVAVRQATQLGHLIDVLDLPTGSRLFQPAAD